MRRTPRWATLERSVGSASCIARMRSASRGAWHQSSISANSCSSAAAWTVAACGSVRWIAKASAKRAPRCARRRTRFEAGQRLGRAGEPILDGDGRREGAEERRDAHHHERGDDGLGRGDDAAAAVIRRVREHLQRHQRIAADHLADAVRIGALFVRAQRIERVDGLAQHGDLGATEMARPRGQVRERADQRRPAASSSSSSTLPVGARSSAGDRACRARHSASTRPSDAATRPSRSAE